MNTAKITLLARSFRGALERTQKDLLPVSFAQFPRGSCGDTSLILARYLAASGQSGFDLVSGVRGRAQRGNWCTHAWLQCGGIVVDITGDQFPEFLQSVYVGEALPFHRAFVIQERSRANLARYDERTRAALGQAYAEVCKNLKGWRE